MDWTFALNCLATVVAVLDPVGATAIFLAMFAEQPAEQRRRAARIVALTVLLSATGAFLFGERLLSLFGISVAAFKVAGGLVIAGVGLSMLQGRPPHLPAGQGPSRDDPRDDTDVRSLAIVPLGVPIVAGAGTLSTVILFSHLALGWVQWVSVFGVIVLAAALLFAMLRSAGRVNDLLGRTGIRLVTRLLGLVLLAMGVQFVADGADDLFPALSGDLRPTHGVPGRSP
jgi:multiple antibiotic resistance protein